MVLRALPKALNWRSRGLPNGQVCYTVGRLATRQVRSAAVRFSDSKQLLPKDIRVRTRSSKSQHIVVQAVDQEPICSNMQLSVPNPGAMQGMIIKAIGKAFLIRK